MTKPQGLSFNWVSFAFPFWDCHVYLKVDPELFQPGLFEGLFPELNDLNDPVSKGLVNEVPFQGNGSASPYLKAWGPLKANPNHHVKFGAPFWGNTFLGSMGRIARGRHPRLDSTVCQKMRTLGRGQALVRHLGRAGAPIAGVRGHAFHWPIIPPNKEEVRILQVVYMYTYIYMYIYVSLSLSLALSLSLSLSL